MTDIACIHFCFCDVFVSVIMALIVSVNHFDRVRDGDRVFVCMTVILIVTFIVFKFISFSSFLSSSLYFICKQFNWFDCCSL